VTARAGLISYDGLPVGSGGGHGLGRLGPHEAWSATVDFMRACTTASPPRDVTLTINSVEDTEPGLPDRVRESAVAALGVYPAPNDRRSYGNTKGETLLWRLPPQQAAAAVAWRHSLGRLPSNWLGGPVVISMDWKLRFTAAADSRELPNQGATAYLAQPYDGYGTVLGESACRLTLSSQSKLSTVFFLPFEAPGPELWQYAAFLQSKLPFQFSPKHWKHWRLTKGGTSYVGHKIRDPVLSTA
jgi:hypothetical protein